MTSLDAVQENALPAVERILDSAGNAVVKFAPKLSSRVTSLVQNIAPSLLRAATSLMTTAGSVVLNTLPDVVDNAVDTVVDLIEGADGNAVIDSVVDVATRVTNTATRAISRIITKGLETIQANPQAIVDTIAYIVETAASTLADLIDSVDGDTVVSSVIDLATRIVGTATRYVPRIINKALSTIRANGGQIRAGIKNIATQIISSFAEVLQSGDINEIVQTFTDIWLDVFEILATNAPVFIDAMFKVVTTVITTALQRVKENPQGAAQTVIDILGAIITGAINAGGVIITEIGSTLTSLFNDGFNNVDTTSLGDTLSNIFGGLFDGVTGLDPESVANFCVNAVNTIASGLGPAIETAIPTISGFISSFVSQFTSDENLETLGNAGSGLLDSICSGIHTSIENGDVQNIKDAAVKAVTEFVNWVTSEDTLKKVYDAGGELIKELGNGLDGNIETLINCAGDAIGSLINFLCSDYTLSKIIDAGIDIMVMIARGIWNGITDVLGGIAKSLAISIAEATGNHEYAEELKKKSNKEVNLFHTQDDWYIGRTYNTFRDMEYMSGDINYEEYLASRGKGVKEADRYKYEPALGKYIDQVKNEEVDYKVIVQVDGRVLGETDEQYLNRKQEAFGYY